jgi:hypothetical protein
MGLILDTVTGGEIAPHASAEVISTMREAVMVLEDGELGAPG